MARSSFLLLRLEKTIYSLKSVFQEIKSKQIHMVFKKYGTLIKNETYQ